MLTRIGAPVDLCQPGRATGHTRAEPVDLFVPGGPADEPGIRKRTALLPRRDWQLEARRSERQQALSELAGGKVPAERWLGSSDPSVRRIATIFWAHESKETSQLDQYRLKQGPLEGAAAFLRLKSTFVGKYSHLDPALGRTLTELDKAVREQRQAPETALLSSIHAARNFHTRSENQELTEDERAQAAGLANQASSLVAGWWRDGLCELTGSPDQGDLARLIRERPVAVRGHQLEVCRPAPENAELDKILAQRKPELVGEQLTEALVERLPEKDAIAMLARLLEDPACKARLKPHLEQLRQLGPRARALNLLGPTSYHTVAEPAQTFYRNLVATFPEVADERLIRQMEPLFFDSHGQAAEMATYTFQRLWSNRPELVTPTVKMAMRGLDSVPQHAAWRLFNAAHEAGWRPDRLERDWLVSQLGALPTPEEPDGLALWDSGCFQPGIEAVAAMAGRDPSFLDGLVLPDRKGQLQAVPRALLEHVLGAPGSDERLAEERQRWSTSLFQLIAPRPDPSLEQELLAPLELEGRRTLTDLPPEQRSRLTVLACIPLTEGTRNRLDELLESALPHDQGHLNAFVESLRAPRVDAFLQRFAAPDATPEERVLAARGALRLEMHHSYEMFSFNERMRAALESLDAEASAALESALVRRLTDLAPEKLHQVSEEALCDIQLAATLASAKRTSLIDPLRQLLPPTGEKLAEGPERVVARARFRIREDNDRFLTRTDQSDSQRLERIEETLELAAAWRQDDLPEESLRLWAAGNRGWIADLSQALPAPLAVRATRALIGEEDPRGIFFSVQGRLKGGKLLVTEEERPDDLPQRTIDALEAFHASRSTLEPHEALDHVLGKLSPLEKPVSRGIAEAGGHVDIGPVRLRRRF